MEKGDILGHEPMGTVVEVGSAIMNLRLATASSCHSRSRVGRCYFCEKSLFSCCDTSIRTPNWPKRPWGIRQQIVWILTSVRRFSRRTAEYLRVPFADVGPLKIESSLPDEKVLFLSDIFPTGYMAAENAEIEPGDTVAIWGCGPVAQFAIQSAWMFKAGRVIAIDCVAERLKMAEVQGKAETINFQKECVRATSRAHRGRGPDRCIDAVGCEAHGTTVVESVMDKVVAAVSRRPIDHTRSRGHHVLPQGGHDFRSRRLRWLLDKIRSGFHE